MFRDIKIKPGDKVKVDTRTLPYNYLRPADKCKDYAECEVVSLVWTKNRVYMKLRALYPSRMNRYGYLKYSIRAIGKTVFTD